MAGVVGVAKQNAHTNKQLHDHESLVAIAVLQPSSSTNVLQGKVCVYQGHCIQA